MVENRDSEPDNAELPRAATSTFGLRALLRPVLWATFVAAYLGFLLGDLEWALGIALGALVFLGDVLWMNRHFSALVAHTEARARAAENAPGSEPVRPVAAGTGIIFRLPLVALAIGGILWYMPARPEGVAIGVAIVPLTALWVGIRHRPQPPSDPSPPSESPPDHLDD